MPIHTAVRYHDISCGHRVHGHESKCSHLHGHNYRIHFFCQAIEEGSGPFYAQGKLDKIGRVIDFSVIKSKLCDWLERAWDHKFLVYRDDPFKDQLISLDPHGVIEVPFNPTAENMAEFLVRYVGPTMLNESRVRLVKVIVEETAKCSASFEVD